MFGVADAVGAVATTPAEIGARTGLDPDSADRILRLLAAHGVFTAEPTGYAHNAASELLRSDHPQSLRSYVRMTGMPAFWNRFTELDVAAKTGRPSVDWRALLAYFERHPEEAAHFNAAMVAKSRAVLPAVASGYDFSGFARIADIGGGRGHLLRGGARTRARGVGNLVRPAASRRRDAPGVWLPLRASRRRREDVRRPAALGRRLPFDGSDPRLVERGRRADPRRRPRSGTASTHGC